MGSESPTKPPTMAAQLWKQLPLPQLSKIKRPSKTRIATILVAFFLIQKLRRVMGLRACSFNDKPKMPPAPIPGFTPLNDQIYVRESDSQAPAGSDHPEVVVVFGWGDGLPKHVAKFTDGYRVLYPHAKQILVLSPISKAMFSDHQQRSASMMPIVRSIWPEDPALQQEKDPKILVHAMSNTGAVNYASLLNIYQQVYNRSMPHDLIVMDSTPGGTDFTRANLARWSRAMALGTAGWFPWPFAVTQAIWAFSLCINQVIGMIRRSEHAGAWARKAVNDTKFQTNATRRLYMYSKEDDLIGWEDIEDHVAEGRTLGWKSDVAVFEGSGHVQHMRVFGDKYWKYILDSWQRAVEE